MFSDQTPPVLADLLPAANIIITDNDAAEIHFELSLMLIRINIPIAVANQVALDQVEINKNSIAPVLNSCMVNIVGLFNFKALTSATYIVAAIAPSEWISSYGLDRKTPKKGSGIFKKCWKAENPSIGIA